MQSKMVSYIQDFIQELSNCKTKARACCLINGDAHGTLFLEQQGESAPVKITGEIRCLSKGLHGFHVHEFGDTTNGCNSAGAHFNPFSKPHGGPDDTERHLGDLGNIEADGNGIAKVQICDRKISLFGPNSIVGRSLVVHADKDDLGKGGHELSKLTGNAGGRVGCGIIGVCKE